MTIGPCIPGRDPRAVLSRILGAPLEPGLPEVARRALGLGARPACAWAVVDGVLVAAGGGHV